MKAIWVCAAVGAFVMTGCVMDSPLDPGAKVAVTRTSHGAEPQVTSGRSAPGRPGYEPAYVGGQTVEINAIEVPPVAPGQAQADFYEVVYPNGWENLNIGTPQCHPCDHDQNGIDGLDFHDHVLDSMPSAPGHGEFSPLWHVFVVAPAYNGNTAHDALVTAALASHLPAKSESAVDALLAARLDDGSPVSVEIDTHFYFICAVVSANAAR